MAFALARSQPFASTRPARARFDPTTMPLADSDSDPDPDPDPEPEPEPEPEPDPDPDPDPDPGRVQSDGMRFSGTT